jgi:putative membrane-bound dehydrogenase-like protein
MNRPRFALRCLPLAAGLLFSSLVGGFTAELGAARVEVTPAEPIRLTGYASRKAPHVGVEQKLWAKALAIGSDREGPAVLVTLDNCGIADETYREVGKRLAKHGIKQDRFTIACSHTHSAPATKNWAPNIFVQDLPPEQQAAIDRYTADLVNKLEEVVLDALRQRQPGKLSWAQGTAGFAANRRTRGGPVDHSLPVLKAETASGNLLALMANYACHCTTLGGEFNHVCGDWAGYAQEAIERDHPGAVALVTIGCGADANPSPRGGADFGLALAKRHGEELAAEVNRLLGQNFTPLTNRLQTAIQEVALPFAPHFTRDQWQARSTNAGIVGYHAKKWLARLDRGEKLPESLYYPITTWNFGDDLALVFLPGEVVVDFELRLKRELNSERLWVSGYANYVPCYIPSRRILAEGGYEAEDSLWYYDRPARLSTNAEDLIIRTVKELVPQSFQADPKKAELPDPKSPQQALGTFRTKADLVVDLAASEPLIESPVAIDWDTQGRLWVCEMYDYPSGLNPLPQAGHKYGEPIKEPPGGFTPGGRIKVLTDTDGDGRYDKAALFLDRLSFPTGVMPWRKGALICAAPNILYAEDTDGDGRADVVRTNITGFATHNFQARINGFTWGLDGWLHGSSGLFGGKVKSLRTGRETDLSGRDFRYHPDTGEIEPVSGISQMGRVRDDYDCWFGNDNSTLLWFYPLPDHYLRRNPNVAYPDPRVNVAAGVPPAVEGGILPPGNESGNSQRAQTSNPDSAGRDAAALRQAGTPAATDPNKLFPISRTLERFNDPQAANRVTSACGPGFYRDYLLGAEFAGNAFIPEPVHNLVRRMVLEPAGATFAGRRAADELRGEFLASTDNWFRPVQARTGPDGALWVVDMYRFVVEHPRWIPPERLKTLDPRAGADLGRIYRVYPRSAKLRPIRDLTKLNDTELAEALNTPNGPARDLAHIELVNRTAPAPRTERGLQAASTPKDAATLKRPEGRAPISQLAALAGNASLPEVRAQTLAALQNLGTLSPGVVNARLTDKDPGVRRLAIRAAEPFLRDNSCRLPNDDPDPAVRLQLALSLGEWHEREAGQRLGKLAATDDPWLRAAVLSSAASHSSAIFNTLLAAQGKIEPSFAGQLAALAAHSPIAAEWQQILRAITPAGSKPAEAWQWEMLPGLFDALDRNHITALALSTSSWEESRDAANRIWKSVAGARALATNEATAEATRVAAVRLLGRGEGDKSEDLNALFGFLQPGTAPRLQSAATEALRRQRGPRVAELALARWSQTSPAARATLVSLLLSRDEWATELLKAAGQGAVAPGEIALDHRPRLLQHKDAALRERAEKVFGPANSGGRADVMSKYQGVAQLTGAVERGAAVFDKNCAQCHAFRGLGHEVGANLGEFAGKSVADFVQAILDPNSAINPNYLAYHVETKDGRSLSGVVRGETASGLTLVQGGGVRETILRSDLKEIRAGTLSLMPEGLEQAMSPQDVADLIAWIKKSAPAPFGGASEAQAAKARAEFAKSPGHGPVKILAAGGQMPYPGWMGRLPLHYCRQDQGMNRLAWEMSPVVAGVPPAVEGGILPSGTQRENSRTSTPQRSVPPGGTPGSTAGGTPAATVFRLPAAMGFLSQPPGKFSLRVNGQPAFDFNVSLNDSSWQSTDGRVRMNYTVMEVNGEDSCGVLEIEVAPGLVKKGEPARCEVIGSGAGSQRWFGIYLLPGQP